MNSENEYKYFPVFQMKGKSPKQETQYQKHKHKPLIQLNTPIRTANVSRNPFEDQKGCWIGRYEKEGA